MGALYINVKAGDEGRIPIDIAGGVMVGIQRLLGDLGRYSLKTTLGLQGDVPQELLSRFTLYVDDSASSIMSSADLGSEGHNDMMQHALSEMVSLLDMIGKGSFEEVLTKYPDPRYRLRIADDLRTLLECLRGLELHYSADGMEGTVSGEASSLDVLSENARSFLGEAAGVLRRSGGDVFLEIGKESVALEYDDDGLTDSPCVISGRIHLSDGGRMECISDITSAEGLPYILFYTAVSSDKELALGNPLSAEVDYDNVQRQWVLSNGDLGLSISGEDLDSTILEFHEQFVFMWELYKENSDDDSPDDDLDDDELQLRNYIMSIVVGN